MPGMSLVQVLSGSELLRRLDVVSGIAEFGGAHLAGFFLDTILNPSYCAVWMWAGMSLV